MESSFSAMGCRAGPGRLWATLRYMWTWQPGSCFPNSVVPGPQLARCCPQRLELALQPVAEKPNSKHKRLLQQTMHRGPRSTSPGVSPARPPRRPAHCTAACPPSSTWCSDQTGACKAGACKVAGRWGWWPSWQPPNACIMQPLKCVGQRVPDAGKVCPGIVSHRHLLLCYLPAWERLFHQRRQCCCAVVLPCGPLATWRRPRPWWRTHPAARRGGSVGTAQSRCQSPAAGPGRPHAATSTGCLAHPPRGPRPAPRRQRPAGLVQVISGMGLRHDVEVLSLHGWVDHPPHIQAHTL